MISNSLKFNSHSTFSGFPVSLIKFLRCKFDGSELESSTPHLDISGFIMDGLLRCNTCEYEVPIVDGIVRTLEYKELDAESVHELRLRDQQITSLPDTYEVDLDDFKNTLEMNSTLSALSPYVNIAMLELACGIGRYTHVLMDKCSILVAVDFSLASLRKLSEKIPPHSQVGLVQADITKLAITPRSFDRILSTTTLDSQEQRMMMYRIVADSLTDKGRYVFSTEHYDLRNRLLGQPRARRYTPGGMYYCHMEKEEILRETAPFFRDVRARPITAIVPLSGRLGRRLQLFVSRTAERLPLVRSLGELLLVCSEAPIRQPKEGEHTSGSRLYKAIYHWYSNRIHRNI